MLSAPGTIRTVEYRSLTKDGRWLWMEAVARNEVDNPAVRGVVANSRDISDRKRADAERHKLEQQLLQAQKLESLGVLAGGVAHDFNNLLAIILAELGQLEPRMQTEQEAVSHIDNAARRAADLATQLLTYAGRREPVVESTELVALIRELEPLLRLSARGEATLRLELAPSTSAVRCDRGQVRQILLNLVINATEALAGPGTVTVRLGERTVEVEELARGVMPVPVSPGRAVVLEVEDTGAGMAEDTLQRIFGSSRHARPGVAWGWPPSPASSVVTAPGCASSRRPDRARASRSTSRRRRRRRSRQAPAAGASRARCWSSTTNPWWRARWRGS